MAGAALYCYIFSHDLAISMYEGVKLKIALAGRADSDGHISAGGERPGAVAAALRGLRVLLQLLRHRAGGAFLLPAGR